MSVIQKLIVDKELTNNIQVIVRDETGLYNPSNPNGYGGNNGNNISTFSRYIFDLTNLYTNVKYRQIQSDDLNNNDEYHNPTIARIANKENVDINSNNFDLVKFEDGLYNLQMSIEINSVYTGNGEADQNVITDISDISNISKYNYIITGNTIYKIIDIVNTNIILDKPIIDTIVNFKPILSINTNLIISDDLNNCINKGIANLCINNCNSNNNIDNVNVLSEIQLYYWGINRSISINDINQAYEFFKLAKGLLNNINYYD